MRAPVQRDDARVVDHLVEDDHVVGCLEQLHVVVVGARRHRWPRVEAEQAALRDTAILGAMRMPSLQDSLQFPAGFDLRPYGRNAPIWRIDDK